MDRSVFFNLTNSVHSSFRRKESALLRSERIRAKSYHLYTFPRRQNMIPVTTNMNDTLSSNEISFQGFIAHRSLGRFLFLASKVKTLRLSFIAKTVPNPSEVSILLDTEHKQTQEHEQNEMASYVREKLLGKSFENLCLNDTNDTVSSMMYESQRFLDSLMYDSIQVLVKDLENCMKWYARVASSQPLVNSSARVTRIPVNGNDYGKNSKKGSSDAIAVKYSKEQTDILTNWMIEHKSHPFPKADEINNLAKATNLSYSQVVNWTTNVRKRNLKATVEKGKKPHHFLDFLFLADDRDKQGISREDHDRVSHVGSRRKSTLAKSSAKEKKSATLKASMNKGGDTTKVKSRLKRTKMEDKDDSRDFPLLAVTNHPPPLVISSSLDDVNMNTNSEAVQSLFTTPMSQKPFSGSKYIVGSYPNLNSVLSFVPLPRQVTPPRSSSVGSNHATEKDYFDHHLNDLPPVDEMLNWPENDISYGEMATQMNIVEDEPMSEDALVNIFTQNGLVSTPKRRDSLEILKDLDDDKFVKQLENVFQEKEEECMSLSDDDLDAVIVNDVTLDDSFLSLDVLDDLEF